MTLNMPVDIPRLTRQTKKANVMRWPFLLQNQMIETAISQA
jgi:hypothetical protein